MHFLRIELSSNYCSICYFYLLYRYFSIMLMRKNQFSGSKTTMSISQVPPSMGPKFLSHLYKTSNTNCLKPVTLLTSNKLKLDQKQNIPPALEVHKIKDTNQQNSKKNYCATNQKFYEQLKIFPCGLVNLGNTCYMNSTLQCLFHLKYFSTTLIKQISKIKKITPVTYYIGIALKQMLNDGGPLILKGLKKYLSIKCNKYLGNKQQDAKQFLGDLLEALDQQLTRLDKVGQYKLFDGNLQQNTIQALSQQLWEYSLERQNSLIGDIFDWQQVTIIKCKKCKFEKANFDRLRQLSIEIKQKTSVFQLIKNFCKSQKPQGYRCEKCFQENQVQKHNTIFRLPKVLYIYLKRFKNDELGLSFQYGFRNFRQTSNKNHQRILIDQILDMKSFLHSSANIKKTKFKLKGVVDHLGRTIQNGHYKAQIYSNSLKKWYNMSDTQVNETNLQKQSKTAVLLFYQQQD